ncbi:hypothetical protein B0J12DRAFT_214933 [Macrophomina phaseolina]|uniref:Uncharacterized protein n=1 Tax=Macrophomina phaseolina TaxID=35725 RepID=A0ABQ8G2N6_9PEZI|nr:hypothetical protein B0J12DRAFT_214933 [Macrophomina phaseolina]
MFRRRRRRQKRMREQNAALTRGSSPCGGGDNRDQLVRTPNSRTGLDPTMTSTLTSSIPGNGPASPPPAHCHGLPLELESPMAMHHGTNPHHGAPSYFPNPQQRSVYELPADHADAILPAPKPSYSSLNNHYNPDEKDPNLFTSMNTTTSTAMTSSFPESPASSTMTSPRGTYRNGARWEEVLPDGNGEITFSTIPRTLSSSPPPPHSASAGGTITATAQFPHNIAGIAYGFGGGGGMAGGAAPGYMGSAEAARDRWANGTWSSDGRASAATSHDGSSPGGFNGSEQPNLGEPDAHNQPPPRYVDGWAHQATVHEAEGDKPQQSQQQPVHESGGREIIRLVDTPGPMQMREVVRLADMGPYPEREVVRLVDLPPSPERERGEHEHGRNWPAVGSMRR